MNVSEHVASIITPPLLGHPPAPEGSWCICRPSARCLPRRPGASTANWHLIKCQIKHQFRASHRPRAEAASSPADYSNPLRQPALRSAPHSALLLPKNCSPGGWQTSTTSKHLSASELLRSCQDPTHQAPLKRSLPRPTTKRVALSSLGAW
jgi:hypothetical protein